VSGFRGAVAVVFTSLAACFASPDAQTGGGGGAGFGGGFGGGSSFGGGSNTGGGGVSLDAGLPEKNACAVLDMRRCDYYARCGLIDSSEQAKRDCIAFLAATWCGPSKWPARVDVGTLVYDPIAGEACADAFLTRACDKFQTVPTACDQLVKPNVAAMQPCYDGYTECTDSSKVCRGAACPRTCQDKGMLNDVCQRDTDCFSDSMSPLFCKLSAQATGSGTCQAYGAVNALCGGGEPCAVGLQCVLGKCIAPPTEGMPCPMGACDNLSWCQSTADGGTCVPRQPLSASCTDDVHCLPGLICQMMQCVPKVVTDMGAECSDRQTCPMGTVCVDATAMQLGHCLPPLMQDQVCISTDDCAAQLACTSADGGLGTICNTRAPNGASCTGDRDCQLYSRCLGNLCTRLPYTGQDCTATQACLFGPCVGAADGGSVCADRFGPGAMCSHDEDCASLRCLSGLCLPTCAP
jgi:hypothetical protein